MQTGKHDDEAIRRIVAAEVNQQLKPFAETLKAVHKWQLSFWSNGSNGPLGFFQMRMREDDERNAQIKDDLKKQNDIADRLDDYIKEQKTLKEHREQRWKTWGPIIKWAGGIMGTAIVGLATWLGPKIVKAANVLIDDYLQHHPSVTEQLKNSSNVNDPTLSSQHQQQSAGGPAPR
jgi:hypothetical protein